MVKSDMSDDFIKLCVEMFYFWDEFYHQLNYSEEIADQLSRFLKEKTISV